MSYTLEFWAAPVERLVAELTKGETGGSPEKVAERAAAVLEDIGEYIDSVSHDSSGGDWFRDEFIDGTLADLIGAEPAGFLVGRELAGTEWEDHPAMGWLTKAELERVIATLDEAGDEALIEVDDAQSEELLEAVVDALRAAVTIGNDLIVVYS